MAAERVMGTLIDVVKEAVLAAVREELAAHKEEVDELQNMMIAVEERNAATAAAMGRELAAVKGELAAHKEEEGDELRHTLTVLEERYEATVAVMEERGSKLAAVKREVTAVKGELAGVKSWLGEHLQLEEADRRRVAEMREMRRQGGGRGKELAAESAPVKGELAEHKQSTMLEQDKAVRRQMAEMRGQVEERERDLTAVKGGLVEIKDAMAEQVIMAERIRQLDLRELREEARKGKVEMRAKLAREREERRREVQELNWPRVMAELAACKEWQKIQDMKMNIELEIKLKQSEGYRRKALEAITAASQATQLNLKNLKCLSDDILPLVFTMTHLTSVDLTATAGFSAEGVKHLYRLARLEVLGLENTGVSDSALEGIGSLTSVKMLDLEATKVTNAGLQHLTGLSSLEVLWLSKCKGVTDAGMPHLTGLSSLKVLLLCECKGVTNAGMVHVGRLTGLEELALDGTAVTDGGLQQLTALTKLTKLWTPEDNLLVNDAVRRRIDRYSNIKGWWKILSG